MPIKKVAIIQARMASTRLPGKILMDIGGKPMLAQVVNRVAHCRLIDEWFIATSDKPGDDPVQQLARELDVSCFRGSETDVLSRFMGAAKVSRADVIVRITADCPLIDPGVVDRVVAALVDNNEPCDYASNVQKRSFPHGLDTEAFFLDTLLRMDRLGKSPLAREHVTTFLRLERPELFLSKSVEDDMDHSRMRWTVDAPPDLEVIRQIYYRLDLSRRILPYREVIDFIEAHPDINRMNAGIETWQPEQTRPS